MKDLISLKKAEQLLSTINIKVLSKKRVSVFKACGRILAQDIVAPIDVPFFSRAAMDGYAIRAEDTQNASINHPHILKVKGEIINGNQNIKEINPGEAIKIYTGCIIPKGANAVVKLEDVEESSSTIKLFKTILPGKNISYKGEDIHSGSLILKKGRILKPHHLGIISSCGFKSISVFKKPTVSIIATGNELIEVGFNPSIAKTLNSNSPMIYCALKELNCNVLYLGIAKDYEPDLIKKLSLAISKSDAVITIGGMSVGKMDIVSKVISKLGKILFHGVRIKPGKPCGAAIIDNKPVLMLPGYPVAALLTFKKFFPIILSKLMDNSEIPGRAPKCKITINTNIKTPKKLTYFIKVNVDNYVATPIKSAGSGVLSAMLETNAIIEIPEHINVIVKNDTLECNLLG